MSLPRYLKHNKQPLVKDLSGQESFFVTKPIGVTIKASLMRGLTRALKTLKDRSEGGHYLIDRVGRIHYISYEHFKQRHGGQVLWNGHNPDHNHILIVLMSWGIVDIYRENIFVTETEEVVKLDKVKLERAHSPNEAAPFEWDSCTKKQVESLKALTLWLIDKHDIDPDNVCGINEARIDKDARLDPGPILPFTMSEFRTYLHSEIARR